MRGNSGALERSAEAALPYVGHVAPGAVALDDGSLLAMGRLRGVPHELASASERDGAARSLNGLWRNIADDTVTIGAHFVRYAEAGELPPARFSSSFAAELDEAYTDAVLRGRLYRNEWFLSVVMAPRLLGTGREISRALSRMRSHAAVPATNIDAIEDLWVSIARSLDAYEIRRLELRRRNGVVFSEIAEALRLILTCEELPVPLVSGWLGNVIYTDRAIFGRNSFEIRSPGSRRYGAIFGLREYMAQTRAGLFDALLQLPMPLVLSQSFGFLARPDALGRLGLKENQMRAAGDKARSQIAGLGDAQDHLASGELVMGSHHLSLAVYAPSHPELDRRAALARSELANSGAVVAQESLGIEAAYFAQLPGNREWRTRPGAISSRNFAHLAGFGAFPAGAPTGRWGRALVRLKTTADTPYDYQPHVGDVGMTAVFGGTGSGKTVLLTFLAAMFNQAMGERGMTILFDKDRGMEILVEAMKGKYLIVRSGDGSGLAPMRGFDDTPYARSCLVRWLKTLIEIDGHGPVLPDDMARLQRGVEGTLRLPIELRSIASVRQWLGWKEPRGAGARLDRWCRAGALGWAFDGEEDRIDFGAPVVGFDLTAILEDAEIVNPAAQYLRDRIRPAIDGRRAVISFDEARAYLLSDAFEGEIKDFLLTLRKQNGICIVSTQQPEDMLHGTFGATLVGQCQTQFYAPTPTASEEVYRDQLFFTAGELAAVRERMLPGSRQFLIKRCGAQTESVIANFDLSALPDWFVAVLSGRARTARLAERLRTEHGEDWLSIFAARHREAVD